MHRIAARVLSQPILFDLCIEGPSKQGPWHDGKHAAADVGHLQYCNLAVRSLFYSDVLVLDTQTKTWSQHVPPFPFKARANHTATLINSNQIWFIAGSDCENVLGDVFVLNTTTSSWHAMAIK